ncbi:hypothetical protein L873DRAFT_896321 [Choiromyces venosus 120613-1]|uniref:Uncharacterized protein n=1 Tax=Choiromyces venosus 120613-1 TaxID=1336337 RepID=A0A3N4JQR6_9PEZI|nr:hypothetical protein L873DRAFT_896321 [Choiromyces venosus 120613-1]
MRYSQYSDRVSSQGCCTVVPVVPDGQNPKNLSGTANDPGQQIRFWCKEIQNSQRFIRGNEESGRVRSGTTGCNSVVLAKQLRIPCPSLKKRKIEKRSPNFFSPQSIGLTTCQKLPFIRNVTNYSLVSEYFSLFLWEISCVPAGPTEYSLEGHGRAKF